MSIFNFNNSYATLSKDFFAEVNPTSPENPDLVMWNVDLAKQLDLDISKLNKTELAAFLSGKMIPEGAHPLAMAYAGHQFGHFTMLGDGRAILLGEHITKSGARFDIQLKGSGRTPFSRGGDGRATLRAMLREYLISECMHALGVPTSRSLALVKTGIPVNRETVHDGAILTRVMDSHIRVGTFEFARQYLDIQAQKSFLNYTIQRHFPEISNEPNKALAFLKAVQKKQLDLIVHWMRIGFIHGVMNTDNMHIGGQTFDYGPCAFMDTYDTKTVFSSIDTSGRYAYGNQPEIALWNLSVLAGAILPQIDDNQEKAVEMARQVLNNFSEEYRQAWRKMMCAKIGLDSMSNQALILLDQLLTWMETHQADYTNTFLVISGQIPDYQTPVNETFKHWLNDLKAYINKTSAWEQAIACMKKSNPLVIPRNHIVEKALDDACLKNDYNFFHEIIKAVKSPASFENLTNFQRISESSDDYKTYCGT